jgi:hypothetical protein
LIEPVVFWCDNTAQKESGQIRGLEYRRRYLLDGRSRVVALDRFGWSLDGQPCRTRWRQTT